MREILLTSSALILALLLLRQAFRNKISRRVQYALWLLVLARLLVPVSLPGVDFSLLTAAEPVGQAVTQRLERQMVYRQPLESLPAAEPSESPAPTSQPENSAAPSGEAAASGVEASSAPEETYHFLPIVVRVVTAADLLRYLWIAGMILMGLWLLITNLRFWSKLRKARIPYRVEGCKYPVYLVEHGLASPCLFGLARPAIYLTPAAVQTPERLRHVIAHESAHARHLDPLWALLRGVCLAVWWFNPLVWATAMASKADGELACDEAALAALGPAERVPYGQTLLALIPVRRGPGDPLLSATTMTAGKRQLKDRITRIAQGSQTRSAALFLVLALAAVVCAVTFTGAKTGGTDAGETVPLTGDELAYFNEEFFNHDTVNNVVGVNIHNQFLTSLYEQPEDIDLYELFYCGTGLSETMSEMEWQLTGSFDANGELICPTDKLSVDGINAVLLENTGLTLAETAGTGLEQFQYLPEYDAYYHTHGDTNYFHSVQIAAGERQGNTVHLYYPNSGARYQDCDWLCVTLERQDDGSFWFVSNLPAEKPAIPTVYPEGDPVLTIPLGDLTPIAPEPVTVTRRQNDCAERGGGTLVNAEDGSQVSVRPYLSTDGNMYLAVIYDAAVGNGQMITWDVGCFFTFPAGSSFPDGVDSVSLGFFSDLFGHDGVVVSYLDPYLVEAHQSSIVRNYYYFEDADTPVLLAQACGAQAEVLDLDGDGENELLTDCNQLFFRRDGQLYEADIAQLLEDHWPEFVWWDYSLIDTSRRCLTARGFMAMPDWGEGAQCDFFRSIYFDGESLLVYDQLEDTVDHAAESVLSAGVPDQVLADAKAKVQSDFETAASGVLSGSIFLQPYDDWRVSYLNLVGTYTDYPTGPIEVYSVGYEFHAAAPASVVLAGGMYLQEDGWVGGFYTESSPYLVYEVQADGSRTRLENRMAGDYSEDSPAYRADLCFTLLENGLLTPSQVRDADLYYLFYNNQSVFLNLMGTYDAQEQQHAMQALTAYAVSVAGTPDDDLLELGLQNLAWNSSALTEAGREAYERLLAAVEQQEAVDAEAALSSFAADPASFLAQTLLLPEAEQEASISTLAAFYNGGTTDQKARFSDALHSLTQPQLDASATALYEQLRAACDLPGPAARSAAENDAVLDAVRTHLEESRSMPGIASLRILDISINEEETARMVDMWVASLSANQNGWSDAYTARMTAVQVVFEVTLDPAAMDADTASLSPEDGVNARWYYLLPAGDGDAWEIWSSMTCAVPAQYRADPENLPWASFAEPVVSFSRYDSQAAARDAILNQPDSGIQLYEELEGPECTVLSWAYGGTPHGTAASLNVLYPDGTVARLPLPPRSSVGAVCDPAEGLTLSADGTVLTYTASFDDALVTSDGTALIHKAGIYRYTYDIAARTVALEITES